MVNFADEEPRRLVLRSLYERLLVVKNREAANALRQQLREALNHERDEAHRGDDAVSGGR